MNRVDRSQKFIDEGRSVLGDRPGEHRRLPQTLDLVETGLTYEDFLPARLAAWAGRSSDGFHVQGLVDAEGRTYISCALNGQYETFEVKPGDAADAFEHPFAYGATLPL